MITDFILAIVAGIATESFAVIGLVLLLGALFWRPERPFASGILRLAFIALGISALMSLFGGGGDCDCDL
jgi:hypothetical protein